MDPERREESNAPLNSARRISSTDELREHALAAVRDCLSLAQKAEAPAAWLPRDEDVQRVRQGISAFARALRAAETTPEQMVVQTKELIEEAGPASIARTALTQHGVSWAIRAFYTDD